MSSARRRGLWKGALRVLPLVVTVGLGVFIGVRFDGWHLLAEANVALVVVNILTSLALNFGAGALRWWLVLKLSDIELRYRDVLQMFVAVTPIAYLAPFGSGHALYAVALKRTTGVGWYAAIENVIYDKYAALIGLMALMLVGQLAMPATHAFHHPALPIVAAAALVFYFLDRWTLGWLARFRWIEQRSRLARKGVSIPRKLAVLGAAALYQSSDILTIVLVTRALGLPVSPVEVIGAYPIVILATYVPISISGFGVRENLLAVVFAASLTYDQAVASGLLCDLVEHLAPSAIGILVMGSAVREMLRARKAHAEATADPAAPTLPRA